MREWEIKEGYGNQSKRIIDDEVAKEIRKIEETPRARNEEAYKARTTELERSTEFSTSQDHANERNGGQCQIGDYRYS